MTRTPSQFLKDWEGNIAAIFLVEIDSKILSFKDVICINEISTGREEFLKSHLVAVNLIKRIHVYGKSVEKKLRQSISGNNFRIPVITSRELYGDAHRTINDNFIITRPGSLSPFSSIAESVQPKIRIVKGDLLRSSMHTFVNTVNCVGVMGKGIALAFKREYPEMFRDYSIRCKNNQVTLGRPYQYCISRDRIIINFPTKNHWRECSILSNVEEGLDYLVKNIEAWGVKSLAVPPLGCGNGKLSWEIVYPLLYRYLSRLNIPIEIYAPHEANSFCSLINHGHRAQTSVSHHHLNKKTKFI